MSNKTGSNKTGSKLNAAEKYPPANGDDSSTGVESIMKRIRTEVEQRCSLQALAEMPKFVPGVASLEASSDRVAGELRDSEHLRYLNFHHGRTLAADPKSIRSHRGGLVGRIVVGLKRRLLTWLIDLLGEYMQQEVAYRAHLVRYLNQVATYGDARDSALFWELISKIDTDIGNALRRIEAIYTETQIDSANLASQLRELIQADLGSLRSQGATLEEKVSVLERVVGGLERILAVATRQAGAMTLQSETQASALDQHASSSIPAYDLRYLLLENRFRGSEEDIANRLKPYVERLKNCSAPIMEIGCGRGELLQELLRAGVTAFGVDVDQAMIAACEAKGLNVHLGDGLRLLEQQADASLGAVIAIQVVEHLTQAQLDHLFRLCAKKVRSGGLVIFETINPRSLSALSSNYFRDPTHVWPLHPDTLAYLMQLGGLETQQVELLSPVPQQAQLQEIAPSEFLSPKWNAMVQHLNGVIGQLNQLLYGHQDYCVVAVVPESANAKEVRVL